MTVAASTTKPVSHKEDPEHYRMSIGDHLEELRYRMIFALAGFVVTAAVCLWYGKTVIIYFCAPFINTLYSRGINPQMYLSEIGESFMVYIHVSLVTAAAFSSPWVLYQLWMFVAAGLYKHERKWVTRYIPLSVTLLISGMLFVYFLVLPWTVQFFVDFGNSFQLPHPSTAIVKEHPPLVSMPLIAGDPEAPPDGTMWFNIPDGRLKFRINGQTQVVPFSPGGLFAPHITVADYIDMVVMMLITFGLSFQLPLVVMALVKIGIVERDTLKRSRRIVYFILLIAASAITPGDVITATIALTFPLVFLYELGIFMARPAKEEAAAAG
jgi:sec-independent protein translocase protein TatC